MATTHIKMRSPRRLLFRAYVYFANALAAGLPDDGASNALRVMLFRSCGNTIPRGVKIKSGTKIWGGGLTLASSVFINRNCYFDMTGPITIEQNCDIGHGVTFVTAGHEIGPPERRLGDVVPKPIRIGSGTWIGANATILPGVVIGTGCMVGAGVVVSKSLENDVVVLPRSPQIAPAAALRFVSGAAKQ